VQENLKELAHPKKACQGGAVKKAPCSKGSEGPPALRGNNMNIFTKSKSAFHKIISPKKKGNRYTSKAKWFKRTSLQSPKERRGKKSQSPSIKNNPPIPNIGI